MKILYSIAFTFHHDLREIKKMTVTSKHSRSSSTCVLKGQGPVAVQNITSYTACS